MHRIVEHIFLYIEYLIDIRIMLLFILPSHLRAAWLEQLEKSLLAIYKINEIENANTILIACKIYNRYVTC